MNEDYRPINWIVSIFSLSGVLESPVGSGHALWSLGYEWVFYFAFPAIVVPLARFRSLFLPLVPIALIGIILTLLGHAIAFMFFLQWLMGAYARIAVDYMRVPRMIMVFGALLSAVGLLLIVTGAVRPAVAGFVIAAGFSVFLARFEPGERGLNIGLDRKLSSFSYSLYVVHFPISIFIIFLCVEWGLITPAGLSPGLTAWAVIIAILALCVCAAIIFGKLFEARTQQLSAWLMRITEPGRTRRQDDGGSIPGR